MQKVKWMFLGYLVLAMLTVVGIALAFGVKTPRDPDTYYSTYSGAVKSLDPAEVNDTVGGNILGYIFEGLYNYKYKTVPYEIVPELASDLPTISDDQLTMTIHVRPGIHYFDPDKTIWPDGIGPEVTANDFVYSFKRVCDFNLYSDNYSFIFQDHFVGLDEWWQYTKEHAGAVDYDRPVKAFEAPDARTLVLHFSKPYPQMIFSLVNCPTAPVCRQLVEHWGDKIRLHPVGTGPYVLSENLRDQRIVLTANPTYRGEYNIDGNHPLPADQRLPHIKRVQLEFSSEPMPAWLQFCRGNLDVNGLPKDAYSQAIGGGGDLTPEMVRNGVVLRKTVDPSTSYIGFNMTDPILGKNKPLRQAMSMAFNRQQYIDKFANGRGQAAIGPVPPGFVTYDPKRINPMTQYNVQAAKRLMVEAVKINGGPIPPLKILFRDSDTLARQTAEYYVDQMDQIGVTLVPQYRDFARWQQMVDNRQTQLFDGGWDSDYPDEQDFLQLFYGPNAPAGGLNSAAYTNPEFDAMYDKSTAMQDTPQRREMYMQLQHMVEDDCPWIIIDYTVTFGLSYEWVGDRFPMDYGHGFMRYTTLDTALRAKRLAERH